MKALIALMALLLTACQAPSETATLLLESEPAFTSDEPCGWDDSLAFHTLGDVEHFSLRYDEEGAILFKVAVYSDGTARLKYQGVDSYVTWTRRGAECLIDVRLNDSTLLTLGNPVIDPGRNDSGIMGVTPWPSLSGEYTQTNISTVLTQSGVW
jgi:hypothetical protein